MISYLNVVKDLKIVSDPERAKVLSRFFKTGKGQYGEGDKFIGVTVPQQRIIARKYKDLDLTSIRRLLHSAVHEQRLTSLLILVSKFTRSDDAGKKQIFNFYINHTGYINNWDLVDLSAPNIVGTYLTSEDKTPIYLLARSNNMWERRIAVLATFSFIKEKQYKDALNIAEILVKDRHDLIHKAVGWMLREIGKRDQQIEEKFLSKFYKTMPRTMLRYAIEKFPPDKRRIFMGK